MNRKPLFAIITIMLLACVSDLFLVFLRRCKNDILNSLEPKARYVQLTPGI